MKKLLVSCMMYLCAGVTMAQVPAKVAEQGLEILGEGIIAGKNVFVEIPLVERSVQNVANAFAHSSQAGNNLVEATVAFKHLTPEQQVALDVRGLAASFDPIAFNYSLKGLSPKQVEQLELGVLAQENKLIAMRATILERQIPLLSQSSQYISEEIAKAAHPASGENSAAWIVEQLPQNLEFLSIAEENAFMFEGLDTMDKLLTALRAKFPEREMVLVTSFVPNQTVIFPGNSIPQDYHQQVWQSAANNNIPVAGVDVSVRMPEMGYMHPDSENLIEMTESSTGETAMGQEEQRKQFMRAVNDIRLVYHRKDIKDPLIILYGRPVNMLYTGFSSVADDIERSRCRIKVLHLAPTSGVDVFGNSTMRTTNFERLIPPSVALQMASPANKNIAWGLRSDMPKISGADIIAKQDRR